MLKRIFGITISVCLVVLAAFMGFAVWHSASARPEFKTDGYVLLGDGAEAKRLAFAASCPYSVSNAGTVRFRAVSGEKVTVRQESFVHFGDGGVMALHDGVLLDFNDLSENFINNYAIKAGLTIRSAGTGYTADTTAGTVTFGDHLWKLSEEKYLIRSGKLTVHYSEEEQRQVEEYVQIHVTEDGIVQILTPENMWMTISEECYVETASGVRIYPVTKLIQDASYKMSLAKLSVSADDSIVLTEEETRRQIVPELHIETMDGKDGQDGEEGQAGEQGTAGKDGSSGKDGTDAAAGQDGSGGSGGAAGSNGQGGLTGNPGQTGNNAVVDSSTNTALPTMTFREWEVTATSLRGVIAIKDENGFLAEAGSRQPGTVKIFDVETGEEILCWETEEDYGIGSVEGGEFRGFNTGAEAVYFSTKDDALKPDTRYRISVRAYYEVNGMLYSREFISRAFYTDSAGVHLAEKAVAEDSITISVTTSAEMRGSIRKAVVYLLTPEENGRFSLTQGGYSYKYELDYRSRTAQLYDGSGNKLGTEEPFDINGDTLVFAGDVEAGEAKGLPSNTKYIARVSVSSGSMEYLTRQELEVSTLKRAPAWSDTPRVTYNRVTGGFEVWRPAVTDPDGGAVSYAYTAYTADGSGKYTVPHQTRTLTVGESEPAVFFLSGGVPYRFGVTLQFDDNEKTVRYDLGRSDVIRAEGASLPGVTLVTDTVEYDRMSGIIRVNLTDRKQKLTVDAAHPLELNVYADQVYNRTITLSGTEAKTEKDGEETVYTAAYVPGSVSNETSTAEVTLSLFHLYRNSGYTVTLVGYLDVGDGNGAVKRAMGTVSFQTSATVPLTAVMDRGGGTTAISMNLRLEAGDTAISDAAARNSYAMEQLRGGQVELQLYAGTGYGATLLATTNINDRNDLEKVFGSGGLEVTEASFGSPALNPAADYTLRVARVTDGTYGMTMGYVNEFDTIKNASAIMVAEATPPDLLMDPARGVTAVPIYKKDAARFGVTDYVDMEAMPEDAIVGYTVQANYDNAQRLGLKVTYYAMEYGAFYDMVKGSGGGDPLRGDTVKLMEVELPIGREADTVPKVAFLFGGTKSAGAQGPYGGYYVYRTGEANSDGETLSGGMDRGYRYVFAYTVEYSRTGDGETTGLYPYDHSGYAEYRDQFGVGQVYGKTLGRGNAYVLNSGMCEAPRVMPRFYTYLHSVKDVTLPTGTTGTASSGTAVVHYTWTGDIDRTISTSGTVTKIRWEAAQGQSTQAFADINGTTIAGGAQSGEGSAGSWYSVEIPYTYEPGKGQNILRPVVGIREYVLDQAEMLHALRLNTVYAGQDDAVYLCRMPVDWAWGEYFRKNRDQISYTVTVNEARNYIRFDLQADAASELDTLLAQRAYALEVTVTAGREEKVFYLPLESALGGGVYARLATGLLGTGFIGREFTTKAAVLYDTGDQGWSLAESQRTFVGVQYAGSADDPVLGDYCVSDGRGGSATSASPGNGLITVSGGGTLLHTLRGNALAVPENGGDVSGTGLQNYYADGKSGTTRRYLRPMHGGVDQSVSPTAMTGSFMTVKAVGRYALTSQNGGGSVHTIVPTVTFPDQIYMPGTVQVTLNSFSVSGADQADGTEKKVTVRMYRKAEDVGSAEKLIAEKTLRLGKLDAEGTGTWVPEDADSGKFSGLVPNTAYVLAFYMTLDGSEVLLMQADGSSEAVYTVKTSVEIEITSSADVVQYVNQSYFDKSLQLNFGLSRSWGVAMRYDIFETQRKAEEWTAGGTAAPYLSHEEMEESGILTKPTALNTTDNVLTINMTPDPARGKLLPGGTYWLRVTALETVSGGGEQAVGSAVFQVVIPPVGNYGALVYVKNATHGEIRYEVTVNDGQFSFMGKKGYENGAGLYTVRFTYTDGDGRERRIRTAYDGEVFSAGVPKQVFTLSGATVDRGWAASQGFAIRESTEYKLHVYAVADPQHNGVSYPTETGGEGRSWEAFFKNFAGGITKFVDSFWRQGDFVNDDTRDDIEAYFRVAEKAQRTTSQAGVLLVEEKAAVGRVSDTRLRLILPESFGLLSGSGEQVYRKILWDVEGRTLGGVAVHYNGTSLAANGDLMICRPPESENRNYEYYYDIPQDIANGNYTITIQLYTGQDDAAPEKTLSFTFYG